jgi:SOS response regulatory protein OraA/RecX
MAIEDTKRIQEETKREIARTVAEQEKARMEAMVQHDTAELKSAMINKGYSIEDIERLCPPA